MNKNQVLEKLRAMRQDLNKVSRQLNDAEYDIQVDIMQNLNALIFTVQERE